MTGQLSKLLRSSAPPSREEVFHNLEAQKGKKDGRSLRATGRTEQFNTRVRENFKDEVQQRAVKAGVTVGRLLELMAGAYDREQAAKAEKGAGALRLAPHLITALEAVAKVQKMTPEEAVEDWLSERLETLGLAKRS